MDKLTGAVAINCGALCGGNFPTSNLGVIFRGLSDTAYESLKLTAPMDSFAMEMEIFLLSLVFSLALITVFRYGIKAIGTLVKVSPSSNRNRSRRYRNRP